MEPTLVYEQILAEITDELERRVFDVLVKYAGRPIMRRDFIFFVFGEHVPANVNLASDTRDRKIRECIARLREKDYAIVSSSGGAGYALVMDEEKVDAYIAEQRSRIGSLLVKVAHARRAKGKLPMVREYQVRQARDEQLKLFE